MENQNLSQEDKNHPKEVNNKKHFYNTEGNEAANPHVGRSDNSNHTISSNFLKNDALASDFEPYGSQRFQYNGQFVTALPFGMHPRPEEDEPYRNQPDRTPAVAEENLTYWTDYVPYYNFTVGLFVKFDKPFVILLGVQNINHGLWTVAVLACQDLFKQYLHLDPGEMTLYMSIIHIPWSVKIIYGLISDNVPIMGTRRKSYIVLMGILQFCSLAFIFAFTDSGALSVAVCLTLAALSEAFVNVVADAIMCIQARKDPEYGSQDLIAFSWMASAIGGVLGCCISGVMTQYFHPKYSFLGYSLMGLVVAANGLLLSQESEEDHSEPSQEISVVSLENPRSEAAAGFWTKLNRNMKHIGAAMAMPEIYMVILFFVINGLISPDFGDFGYYFMLNVCQISKLQYSLLGTIGSFTGFLGCMYYEQNLKDIEVRTLIYWSTVISCISGLCQYGFAMRWNKAIGINDMAFILITDTAFGVISQAMNTLPTLALFAKITPMKIEGTVFAFLTGTTNLASNVLSPMVGVWINEKFFNVTADDLSAYPQLCLVSFLTSFLGFLVVPLVPTKDEIDKLQKQREHEKIANGTPIDKLNNRIILDLKKGQSGPLDLEDKQSRGTSGEEEENRPLMS